MRDTPTVRSEREESVERCGCEIDGVNDVSHDRDRFAPIAQRVGFIEHYKAGYVIHAHARWWNWVRPADVKHFCFRFHWLFDESETMLDPTVLASRRALNEYPIIEDENGAVFIDVVETFQEPKFITRGTRCLSLVWLRPLDFCEFVRAEDSFKKSGTNSVIGSEIVRILMNREVEVTNFLLGQRRRTCRKGIDNMVEHRSQLVNHVAKNDAPFELLSWFHALGADGYILPLRLEMNTHRMRGVYRAALTSNCGFEVFKVSVGPVHFQPNVVNPAHGATDASF